MVKIRDIFGNEISVSQKRSTPNVKPQPPRTLPSRIPAIASANDTITHLMSITRNRMFENSETDYQVISRRISKLGRNKDKILKKAETLLMQMPNYSVTQAIDWITKRSIVQEIDFL